MNAIELCVICGVNERSAYAPAWKDAAPRLLPFCDMCIAQSDDSTCPTICQTCYGAKVTGYPWDCSAHEGDGAQGDSGKATT